MNLLIWTLSHKPVPPTVCATAALFLGWVTVRTLTHQGDPA